MDKLHKFALIKMIENLEHQIAGIKSMLMHVGSDAGALEPKQKPQQMAQLDASYTTDEEDDLIEQQIRESAKFGEELVRRVVEGTPVNGNAGQE